MINPGNILEDFSELFLSSIRGFIVRHKRNWAMAPGGKREHDYDLLINNVSSSFSEFGNYILVECKDWKEKVGYDEVAKFLHKLHSRRCNTGIIIALENVTHEDFNPTIKRAYDQDGIVVIVLDIEDIKDVLYQKINLASLLRKKYESARFGFNS